jgi:hypothetical protein
MSCENNFVLKELVTTVNTVKPSDILDTTVHITIVDESKNAEVTIKHHFVEGDTLAQLISNFEQVAKRLRSISYCDFE